MPDLPFSKLRRVGNTVYLSGELGFNEDGTLPDTITEQTENCLRRIEATLQGADLSLKDVVSCTCYVSDASEFAEFNAAYLPFFEDPKPVRTTVFAGLAKQAKVEVTVIAAS